jgi:hypothetical protein
MVDPVEEEPAGAFVLELVLTVCWEGRKLEAYKV